MKYQQPTTVNTSSTLNKAETYRPHPLWRWFWLIFLVISLAYAGYSFYAPSNNINWIDNINIKEELPKRPNKKTLLFFTATWCSPCQIMKREVFADKEVEKILNSQVSPVIIDIDNPNASDIVGYYNIRVSPTIVILDSQGSVYDFAVGKIDKKEFLGMLNLPSNES